MDVAGLDSGGHELYGRLLRGDVEPAGKDHVNSQGVSE